MIKAKSIVLRFLLIFFALLVLSILITGVFEVVNAYFRGRVGIVAEDDIAGELSPAVVQMWIDSFRNDERNPRFYYASYRVIEHPVVRYCAERPEFAVIHGIIMFSFEEDELHTHVERAVREIIILERIPFTSRYVVRRGQGFVWQPYLIGIGSERVELRTPYRIFWHLIILYDWDDHVAHTETIPRATINRHIFFYPLLGSFIIVGIDTYRRKKRLKQADEVRDGTDKFNQDFDNK